MIYEQNMATIANQGPSAWAPNKSKVCDHKLPYLARWAGPFGRLIVRQLSICSGHGWKSPRYVVGLTVSRCCCVVYVPLCLARFGCKPRKIPIGGTVRWVNCDNRNRVGKGYVWVVGSKKNKNNCTFESFWLVDLNMCFPCLFEMMIRKWHGWTVKSSRSSPTETHFQHMRQSNQPFLVFESWDPFRTVSSTRDGSPQQCGCSWARRQIGDARPIPEFFCGLKFIVVEYHVDLVWFVKPKGFLSFLDMPSSMSQMDFKWAIDRWIILSLGMESGVPGNERFELEFG